jgi:methionyl-tRNA formyltransferase
MVGLKAVFMGTPAFAAPSLRAMLDAGVEVAAVITQPDRPAGRGRQPAASPVKRLALERGLPVYQPLKIRDPEAVEYVRRISPDVIVVVGYGQIIPRSIFEMPPLGAINVHASLLPKYRGAAPVQWAIANGETVTGVTTMRIEAGLDTGDILMQRAYPVLPEETAPELSARLAEGGAELLVETLRRLEQGTIEPRKQNPAEASFAPLLRKEDGRIDWKMTARQIANRVRGFDPWPGTYTTFRGRLLHLRRVRALEGAGGPPGALAVEGGSLRAACGEGWLELLEVQPEGKRRMSAQDFISGRMPQSGEILGEASR